MIHKHQVTLSSRLQQIAHFLPTGVCFADIGSDHAYLPCYVCFYDKTATAIAGEINWGPYQRAAVTVAAHQLQDRVKVRQGNGLEVIADYAVEEVVIAGMGGALIQSILENGKEMLAGVERIIAQPNTNARNVRKWLSANHYQIIDETVIEEKGHIYEMVVADKQVDARLELSERELLFGPVLLTRKPQTFIKKWQYEREKLIYVIEQMKQASTQDKAKITKFERSLRLIEEVLQDDRHRKKC